MLSKAFLKSTIIIIDLSLLALTPSSSLRKARMSVVVEREGRGRNNVRKSEISGRKSVSSDHILYENLRF